MSTFSLTNKFTINEVNNATRSANIFIGYRLLGEFSGIWEAKNFAAESGMSGICLLYTSYLDTRGVDVVSHGNDEVAPSPYLGIDVYKRQSWNCTSSKAGDTRLSRWRMPTWCAHVLSTS